MLRENVMVEREELAVAQAATDDVVAILSAGSDSDDGAHSEVTSDLGI